MRLASFGWCARLRRSGAAALPRRSRSCRAPDAPVAPAIAVLHGRHLPELRCRRQAHPAAQSPHILREVPTDLPPRRTEPTSVGLADSGGAVVVAAAARDCAGER